ncbi:MAG: hypothetical protein FWC70_03285 [Defluviitaleaceae bacterium]|nr:hypothetical protein [Defluviitaleaceae bacterium]
MSTREQIKTQIDILPEHALESVLDFLQKLIAPPAVVAETNDSDDIAAYDAATAEEDEWFISAADLRKKYGI